MSKPKNNYVNNKKFHKAMLEYKLLVNESEQKGLEKPRVPEYVGSCILLIANNLGNKPNFNRYSYLDEMISDGIENALIYIDNFDPFKYNNPFAYFTQVIYNAFIRRIKKEQNQTDIKKENLEDMMLLDYIRSSTLLRDNDIHYGIMKKKRKKKDE